MLECSLGYNDPKAKPLSQWFYVVADIYIAMDISVHTTFVRHVQQRNLWWTQTCCDDVVAGGAAVSISFTNHDDTPSLPLLRCNFALILRVLPFGGIFIALSPAAVSDSSQ